MDKRNTWGAKLRRTETSILPVSKSRRGKCRHCGACCRLPNVCPFLRFDENKKSRCLIYPVRPLNCRKYPRTKAESIVKDCGYKFD